ncbi:diguanylate cyclase (GGDEF)-like protein [Geodermatophilus bullaregiensis]|uniref:putative bifunctional diguanylate cyclase/phosphodiesterase n=1 Tax=Geodermatophilus bullaregiensis TaxID=1564160 RepID=UPI00195AAE7D|nr:bifunctional diguanylate cyclase/phosphodiesterase [Geodermatophilus bullaregiensis]MBM7805050.1 diguanylate cyclase (GGDEF)-like protein [Geodermatophilus bullaregiensis]
MSGPARARLLPGLPRWVLLVALPVPLAAVVTVVVQRSVVPGAPGPGAAGLLGGLGLQAAFCGLLVWRARRQLHERVVWSRLALGSVVFSVAVVTGAVLGLSGATASLAGVPVAWAPVLAFPLLHSGLVRWNRSSGHLADPNDVLNGVAGVLAVVAVLNVVLVRSGSPLTAGPWWEVQALLAQVATGVVLLGTVLSVTALASLQHDPRPWLVAAAVTVTLTGDLGTLLTDGGTAGWTTAAEPAGAALVGLAAALSPTRATPRPADPAASTIGSFVVIAASTVVLLLERGPTVAGCCAALAVTGAGVRLLMNVRELAQLAVSRREALTDELTGLANRRAVLRRVEELGGEQLPVALALLDLDKFKEVNDGLGHAAGDDLLRLVAGRLTPQLRTGDVLGRLGGDEFAVVALLDPGATTEDCAALGRRLARQLDEPFEVGGMSVHAAASVGVAFRPGTDDGGPDGAGRTTTTELLRQADAAMYSAKRTGGGAAVYDAAQHGDDRGRLALVEELRSGLGTGRLVLHHQPQVDVATGRTVGVEALVRWAHPVRGLLSPAEFLPLAEVHGLMRALTDEVLRQAVTQAAAWRRAGRDLRMSANLSASNLLDVDLPWRVADLLRDAQLPADRLVLEITESVLLSDPERSLAVVGRLADLGVTVSIDDFGTGYSSLSYLRDLPVAELKLDRSFTADLRTDGRTEAIVASTITLAHRLGLRVVAEGVEDEPTLLHLAGLGCDETQGHLHSAPLPAARLETWLDRAGAPLAVS